MQDSETFFRICFRCSNSLCCMANLSSPMEQGSLIWTPLTKPTFKPPSPKEADLQSYRAVAGFFCYTKIKNEHRTQLQLLSNQTFSSACAIYKKHLLNQVPPSIKVCMARVYCTGKLSLLLLMSPLSEI